MKRGAERTIGDGLGISRFPFGEDLSVLLESLGKSTKRYGRSVEVRSIDPDSNVRRRIRAPIIDVAQMARRKELHGVSSEVAKTAILKAEPGLRVPRVTVVDGLNYNTNNRGQSFVTVQFDNENQARLRKEQFSVVGALGSLATPPETKLWRPHKADLTLAFVDVDAPEDALMRIMGKVADALPLPIRLTDGEFYEP